MAQINKTGGNSIMKRVSDLRENLLDSGGIGAALRAAVDGGITLERALLALHDSPADAAGRDMLDELVALAMTPKTRKQINRWWLRAIQSTLLPYDRARGYCPVRRSSRSIETASERADLADLPVAWSAHRE